MDTKEYINEREKKSLWEIAHEMGPICELVPGFSFDSDSKIKLYD